MRNFEKISQLHAEKRGKTLKLPLFYRRSLRMAAAAQLGLSPEQSASLENRLSATQMRNRNNLILITAMDSTAEKARELNNVVVRLLLQEFQQFRGGNLEVKLGLLQKQKDAWLKELAECELELQKLLNPTTMASPEQELCNIRKMITDQLFLISELNVKVGNESARLQEINAKLQGLSPDIDNQIKTLNYYLSGTLNRGCWAPAIPISPGQNCWQGGYIKSARNLYRKTSATRHGLAESDALRKEF